MTDSGLQPERTSLAWTRTSFAVLANGALLMVRDIAHHRVGIGLVSAVLAVLVAAVTYSIGVRRTRILARRPLPRSISPRREVYLVTGLVLVLIVVAVVPQLLMI